MPRFLDRDYANTRDRSSAGIDLLKGLSAEELGIQIVEDDRKAVILLLTGTEEEKKQAFGSIYDRHVNRIYTLFFYGTGNAQDAEDLTQKTFINALNSIRWNGFTETGAPLGAWIYTIAQNLLKNWYRDQSRKKVQIDFESLIGLHTKKPGPEQLAEASEVRSAFLAAFKRLPSDRQQLLLLKFTEGMPNAQIGDIMGRSEGAIKSLYHRTLIALKKDLETRGIK